MTRKGWHGDSARHSLAARGLKTHCPKKSRCVPHKSVVNQYQVVVGNIGTVYLGNNRKEAQKTFNEYKKMSKDNYGRAGMEEVSLFVNDEPEVHYHPPGKEEEY